jgi:hypothetical protein
MAKPESQLWSKLKEGTLGLGVFWTRLETWATPGIPDLHGIKGGVSFWLELKVSKLKILNKVDLRPHQIAWQTRYSSVGGSVWNLVSHPSSRSLKLFRGERAMELGEGTKTREPLTPDWETGVPYDWEGLVFFLLTHSPRKKDDEP